MSPNKTDCLENDTKLLYYQYFCVGFTSEARVKKVNLEPCQKPSQNLTLVCKNRIWMFVVWLLIPAQQSSIPNAVKNSAVLWTSPRKPFHEAISWYCQYFSAGIISGKFVGQQFIFQKKIFSNQWVTLEFCICSFFANEASIKYHKRKQIFLYSFNFHQE